MAKPTTTKFSDILLLVGDGADPEVFAAPCGLKSKSINFSAETNDTDVPDCDDPEAAAWKERDVTAFSATISGSGVMAAEAFETWNEWFMSGKSRNVRYKRKSTVPTADGHYEGKFLLTTFGQPSEIGQRVAVEIELQNDGEVVWVPAP